jgi:UrcA family protein
MCQIDGGSGTANLYPVCNVVIRPPQYLQSISGNSMKLAKLTFLLAAFAAGTAQVTLADTLDPVPPSLHVHYSDIDLANSGGAKTLYERLTTAADIVCAPYKSLELAQQKPYRFCVRQAVSAAVADINSPMLTSYYVSKGGEVAQQVAQLDK